MFKLKYMSALILSTLPISGYANLYFDPAFLGKENSVDLKYFESIGKQLPGTYNVDVYINGLYSHSRAVDFIAPDNAYLSEAGGDIADNTGLMACLKKDDFDRLDVVSLADVDDVRCISPAKYIPGAFTSFNFQQLKLDVSIPQVAIKKTPRGWISPERWDEGLNSAQLSYRFNGSENRGAYGNSRSYYLGLNSGINIGPWRLRDNSVWTASESKYSKVSNWQRMSTYAERSIRNINSVITIGDGSTNNDIFESFSFRGVKLGTDENMLPDTMRGFAPEIKGVANSNAQVSVKQNGNLIYRMSVAPGEFVINDLYPVSSGGDLDVTVTEADGSTNAFIVPYSSLPMLQRKGHINYTIAAGNYRNDNSKYDKPGFFQSSLLWGLPYNITAFGGAQLAEKYKAFALGTGANMGGWGAFTADVTQAWSQLSDDSRHEGQSLRLLYGRSLISTGTSLRLAGYRYSSQGFYTLNDTALKKTRGWLYSNNGVDASGKPIEKSWSDYYDLNHSKRERVQLNISQSLGGIGSMYVSGTHQTYRSSPSTNSVNAGFSSNIGKINYNISYGYSKFSGQPKADQTMFLSLSLPLSRDRNNALWSRYSASRASSGDITHQAGMSGTALERGNLQWSVLQGYTRDNGGNSGDASLSYQGTYANTSVGYGYGQSYKQTRYSVSGGIVAHDEGITLSQPLGSTNVLVSVPGAAGVPLENGTGISTDWRGYAVIPYASIYKENRIALDIKNLDERTEIDNPVARVVPTRGAMVKAKFNARTGSRGLITITHNGKPLPFGSTVSMSDGNGSGLVSDNGQVWLSGLPKNGKLVAKWGNLQHQTCSVDYVLPDNASSLSIVKIDSVCK